MRCVFAQNHESEKDYYLSHSHGFAQKRKAFRIHGTAPLKILGFLKYWK